MSGIATGTNSLETRNGAQSQPTHDSELRRLLEEILLELKKLNESQSK